MQTIRQIKNRIKSIENTRKITRAMQMISSVKLARTKAAFHSNQAYSRKIEEILKNMAADGDDTFAQGLFEPPHKTASIALAVIASDSGLCGTYNHALTERTAAFLKEHRGKTFRILAIGQEAATYFRKAGMPVEHSYLRLFGKFNAECADEISRILIDLFMRNDVGEAYVAYMRFSPSLRHTATVERFLPIERPRGGVALHYLTEPDRASVLNELIPRHLIYKIRSTLLEAFMAEHSARMLAMMHATDNASELIEGLTLMRNKARQASITQEVLEIANAAEALKG